jgi:hypothetical protein
MNINKYAKSFFNCCKIYLKIIYSCSISSKVHQKHLNTVIKNLKLHDKLLYSYLKKSMKTCFYVV